VPENLVRVWRSVERRRKTAMMFTCMVPGAWLGAQQAGARRDADLLQSPQTGACRGGERMGDETSVI